MTDWPRIRAWWWHRQGLDGRLANLTSSDVLERAGWARSVGGANPYQTLWTRCGALRGSVEADVANQVLHELPAARGCTYVLPRRHFALGLLVNEPESAELRNAVKHFALDPKEVERLGEEVVRLVSGKALNPKELRESLGDKVRSFGEAGIKRGIASSLPIALGILQRQGRIRRVSSDGSLESQRYAYVAWDENPLIGVRMTREEALAELARLFFGWDGPATMKQFQEFIGLGAGAAKMAAADLDLVEVGAGLVLPSRLKEQFDDFNVPSEPQYRLTSSLDAIINHRRDAASLVDAVDLDRTMLADGKVARIGSSKDLGGNAIFDRGRLIGLWEYDVEAKQLVWMSFVPKFDALVDEVRRTEAWVREDMGDVRSFSLDSPASRKPRIEFLRSNSR